MTVQKQPSADTIKLDREIDRVLMRSNENCLLISYLNAPSFGRPAH